MEPITGAIFLFIGVVLTISLSIIAHEYGHVFFVRNVLKSEASVYFSISGLKAYTAYAPDFNKLTNDEKKGLFMSGVFLGYVPIILALVLIPQPVASGIFFSSTLLYFVGCKHDINGFMEVVKNEN